MPTAAISQTMLMEPISPRAPPASPATRVRWATRKVQELKTRMTVQELKMQQFKVQELEGNLKSERAVREYLQAKQRVQELQAQLASRGVAVKSDTPRPCPKGLERRVRSASPAPRRRKPAVEKEWAEAPDICDECGTSDRSVLRCPNCNTCACAECDASKIDSVDFSSQDYCSEDASEDDCRFDGPSTVPLPLFCSDVLPVSSMCARCRTRRIGGTLP